MMNKTLLSVLLLFSSYSAAFTVCADIGGAFPYAVYETTNGMYLGNAGYRTMELCQQAIATNDADIVCTAEGRYGSIGSILVDPFSGSKIGYTDSYFTSVEYCSEAISHTRGGMICIPNTRGSISLFDFRKGVLIGEAYSSVEFCKWASFSAVRFKKDPYVCAMNPKGSTEIFDRGSRTWTGVPFRTSKACFDYLEKYRRRGN